MIAGTPMYCPHCGSTDITIHSSPDDKQLTACTCNACRQSFNIQSASFSSREINERTIDICLKSGYIHGIKYYIDAKSRELGTAYSLAKAKKEVDELLSEKGLTQQVKKPRNNGCLLVIILASIALAIYYFFIKK